MPIYNQIPSALPCYDKIEKSNRFRKNCLDSVNYKLIAPKNAILPFQYRRPIAASEVTGFFIVDMNGPEEVIIDITDNLAFIKTISLEGYDYFYYGGDDLTLGGDALNLGYGYYYAYVEFNDASRFYTEMFFIPNDSFNAEDVANYLKLEWYNLAGDLSPFYYSDLLEGVPVFRNVVYLDTFVTSSEPVITTTTVKDGDDTDIPTFIKATIPHKINLFVPDFLKVALMLIQLHDTINFTSAGGVYSGEINNITSQVQTEPPGCMSTVDLLWEEVLSIVNKSVATNLVRATVGTAFNYLKATLGDPRITYNGDGQLVFTDPNLIGRTGYAIYSQQDGNFIQDEFIEYNSGGGSFTITIPDFDIVVDYYIFIFFNLFNPSDFPG